MDKKFADILVNYTQSAEKLVQLENQAKLVKDFPIANLQISIQEAVMKAEKEKNERFDAFWEAFKYPLQIFDLKKGEKPGSCESVFGYNEIRQIWIAVAFELFRVNTFESDKAIYTFEEMHRWARLPILEKEGD